MVIPSNVYAGTEWRRNCSSSPFTTSASERVVSTTPRPLYRLEIPGTHFTGGPVWVRIRFWYL